MGIVAAAVSNVQTPYPMEVISQGGEIAIISLTISLSIALLISDSKYWNRWASSSLDSCSIALLVTFVFIVVFKVILII